MKAIKNKKWKIDPRTGVYFTWTNFWRSCRVKHDPWRQPLPKDMKATSSPTAPWPADSLDGWDGYTKIDGEKVKLSIGKL